MEVGGRVLIGQGRRSLPLAELRSMVNTDFRQTSLLT
jgi:hypothetical protein